MNNDKQTLSQEVARAAAEWLALLHSGDATPAEVAACEQWRQADPDHARAWERVQHIQDKLGIVPPKIGMDSLNRSHRIERRQAIKTLAILVAAAPAGYVLYRSPTWHSFAADYQTSIGEQRQWDLPDGTRLILNTDSAVDFHFDQTRRLLVLHKGEILIETGRPQNDLPAISPLIVQTRQGRLQPVGTRFLVRERKGDFIQLAVQEGAVDIYPLNIDSDTSVTRIQAGLQTRFTDQRVQQAVPVDPKIDAWSRGELYAQDMRLADFIAELDRYYYGRIGCDPEVADLRISGVFQLKNIDGIIAALPKTLPVSVGSLFGLWVRVKPAS